MTGSGRRQEPGAHAHEPEGYASRGLLEVFRDRRIALTTMDAPLRLATGGALACLVGAALLIALRDVGGAAVVLPVTAGVRTTLSSPLFIATLVLISVGFGYVLTGAVLAHRPLALAVVLVLTGAMGQQTGVLGIGGFAVLLPGWALLATRGLLVAIVVVAAVAMLARRGRPGDAEQDRRLRAALLVVYCGLFGAYLLVLYAASPTVGGLTLFPGTVNLLMVGVALLTTPILQVAAADFGEWGQLSAERLLGAVGRLAPGAHAREARRRFARTAVPAAGCVALAAIAWVTQSGEPAHRLVRLGQGVGLFAVAAGALVVLGHALRLGRQTWPETLNFAGLFAVLAVVSFMIAPLAGAVTGRFSVTATPEVSGTGNYTAAADVRPLAGPGGSTLLVPAGWLRQPAGRGDTFVDHSPTLGLVILSVVRGSLGHATITSLASGFGAPRGPVAEDGPAQRVELAPKAPLTAAVVWLYPVRGSADAYLFYGVTDGKNTVGAIRQLSALVHSFRLPGVPHARIPAAAAVETTAAAQLASADRLETVGDLMQILLGVLALGLVAGVGRRWCGRLRGALLLFGVYALFTVVYFADSLGRVLAGPAAHWPVLAENGTLAGIAVLGLLALLVAARRTDRWSSRLPAALTGLVGGVLALRLVDTLYNDALSASRVAVWAAVLVLVAVAWDVTMSGESMTNHASRYLPRSSRVFLFFGYVILLAATVVYFSGQRVAGSGQGVGAVFFEPEAYTQAALFRFALPLLVLLFLLRTFGATEAQPAEQHRPDASGGSTGAHETAVAAGAPPAEASVAASALLAIGDPPPSPHRSWRS
ncbi:MAG TPA: hypothetical protein VMU75_02275 [Acidimicrobiales bacterium]|nr:hypothetical protein [Acidimicrobiales bacterium]